VGFQGFAARKIFVSASGGAEFGAGNSRRGPTVIASSQELLAMTGSDGEGRIHQIDSVIIGHSLRHEAGRRIDLAALQHGEPRKPIQNAKPSIRRRAALGHAAGGARAPLGGTSCWARPWAGSGEVEKELYPDLLFSERRM
jgi:hypothetical protein